MKTKKIFAAALAGLCAVSAMGVSAFAAENETTVEAAGEKAYKITAGFVAPTMDVTVPTEIKGVINPYKIKIELDGVEAEAEGVASPKYTITNNSEDVGVKVNATYSADGLDGIVASEALATTGNTKKQKLAYVTLNSDQLAAPLVMSTEEKTTTDPILTLDVKDSGDEAGDIWLGGAVIETPAEKWTTKDKLTINVVLDLVPFNTGNAGPGPVVTPDVEIDTGSSTLNGITLSGTTFTVTSSLSDGAGDSADMTLNDKDGNVIKKTGTDVTVAIGTDADGILTIANNGKITVATTGTPGTYTATIVLTDTVNSKTETYTINMTEVA